MVFRNLTLRHAPAALGLFAVLLVFPGCPLSPDKDEGGGDDIRIPTRDSVDGAIAFYSFVWEQQLLQEYEKVLHDDYEFFIRDADAADFPWIPQDGWNRTIELEIAANMFNDSFISDETQNPVRDIDMNLTVTNRVALNDPPNGTDVTTTVDALVLWAENSGARTNSRFNFVVVPDPDEPGLFQILTQRELDLF